ncbi:RAxF-45 family protein [Aquibacillus albus]
MYRQLLCINCAIFHDFAVDGRRIPFLATK